MAPRLDPRVTLPKPTAGSPQPSAFLLPCEQLLSRTLVGEHARRRDGKLSPLHASRLDRSNRVDVEPGHAQNATDSLGRRERDP